MEFRDAFKIMKSGGKVKLPSWGGYWFWDAEKQSIMMQCRPKDTDKGQGDLLDIRETQRVEYTLSNILSDEWLIADETNCPVLGGEATFGFGDAIKYMKRVKSKEKDGTERISIFRLQHVFRTQQQTEQLLIVITMTLEIKQLRLSARLVYRWDG